MMGMNNKYKLKILLVMLVAILTGGLYGCNNDIETFVQTSLRNDMEIRREANILAARRLRDAGLLNESDYSQVEKSINDSVNDILDNIESNPKKQVALLQSICSWRAPLWVKYEKREKIVGNKKVWVWVNHAGFEEDDWYDSFITTNSASSVLSDRVGFLKGNRVVPLQLITQKSADTLNERFRYPIYILKNSEELGVVSGQDAASGIGLDGIIENVQQFVQDPQKHGKKIMEYFREAEYEENGIKKKLTFFELNNRENELVGTTTGSIYTNSGWDASETYFDEQEAHKINQGNWAYLRDGVIPWSGGDDGMGGFTLTGDGAESPYDNVLGKDLVISQNNEEIIAVRLYEFNQEALDKIISMIGINKSQYFIYDSKLFLMEYPISYLTEFKESSDGTGFSSEFELSNIGINLQTGKLLKYKDGTKEAIEMDDTDAYLSIRGASGPTEETQASFSLYGDLEGEDALTLGEMGRSVVTSRIVLRDYLEATYLPDIVAGENLAVLGRKIRILNFNGTKTTTVGKYYGKDGKSIENTQNLMINDFADIEALNKGQVEFIGNINEDFDETGSNSSGADSEEGESDGSDGDSNNLQDTIIKLDVLPRKTVNSIHPTTRFPGEVIGSVDIAFDTKPQFYGLFVRRNPFDTALFSGWINKNDAESNSLIWWESWLKNHNYSYSINANNTLQYFQGNYSFELQSSGLIVLDLETIAKIQKEYTAQDKLKTSSLMRTAFIVLGVGLVLYGFIACCCWALDTNLDVGVNSLQKISFGHWTAVKDMDEFIVEDNEDSQYLDFKGVVIKSLILAVFGITLTLVDMTAVVSMFIKIFGGLASGISKTLLGR